VDGSRAKAGSDDSNPYEPPQSTLRKSAGDSASRQVGCCSFVATGTLIGLSVGGCYGIREYQAAVEVDVREGGPGDYLPVGVPVWAIFDALLGALAGRLTLSVWRSVISYPPERS
jgi:hypothetical protein